MKTIKRPSGTFTYNPRKPLGKPGGFGQVFIGQNSEGQEVAVKKLHVSAAAAAHRELLIAEELRSHVFEHVVPFIDSGEDADTGDYFLVMPKADGSLQDAVEKDGKITSAGTASVLLEIIQGLNEVGGIVHRDLKPDNVLRHENRWKVADFGIARFIEEVTASNTLKNCLSPFYAAPEQWRFERATHATDVYALGCIGFFLLTGSPPFVTDPELEHQRKPLPTFECDDGRLQALINNMARKLPETRPALARIQSVLAGIVAKPYGSDSEPLSLLATAGAQVAEREQRLQAKVASEQSAKAVRENLGKAALEILSDSVERLWGKIHAQVPNVQRNPGRAGEVFEFKLGDASLAVNLSRSSILDPGSFPRSGWDVIASSQIIANQEQPRYQWSASLWYVKLRGATEYRWHEVSYWSMSRASVFQPFACQGQDADYAASNSFYRVNIAFGPAAIDDEQEDEFHERWIWLFAKASVGQLRRPSVLPFHGWPPPL